MIKSKSMCNKVCFRIGLVAALAIFPVSCATHAKEFDPQMPGPQMIVEPETIRLGVARLTSAEIVFRGKGFQPDDSVFITLVGVKKDGQSVDVPVADANVDQEGCFSAAVSTLVKVTALLRGNIGSDKDLNNVVILSQPAIDKGTYVVRAVSMESDISAECTLVIKGPSLLDRVKDWIGGLLGKIEKE